MVDDRTLDRSVTFEKIKAAEKKNKATLEEVSITKALRAKKRAKARAKAVKKATRLTDKVLRFRIRRRR